MSLKTRSLILLTPLLLTACIVEPVRPRPAYVAPAPAVVVRPPPPPPPVVVVRPPPAYYVYP